MALLPPSLSCATSAIPSEVLLRMRVLPLPPPVHLGLGPQRGSASRGRRPPRTPSPPAAATPSARKLAFTQGKALPGPEAGVSLHGVAANPRGSPHKPRRERRGEGGLPGVERYAAKGWGRPGPQTRVRGLGSDPSPRDPLWPPLRGLEGPGRGGVVEGLPPLTPRLLGLLRAGPRGARETRPTPFPRANLARVTRVSFQISPR
jgi:hypothetical protein